MGNARINFQQPTTNRYPNGVQVFGIIGNPVKHSRSPVLHNASMGKVGFDGVYIPLLVDDMDSFMATFTDTDWAGFSVTIPHKVWPLLALWHTKERV